MGPKKKIRLTKSRGQHYRSKKYCFCKNGSYGEMVCCDNNSCKYKWFHFDCVKITRPPEGPWLCPNCSTEEDFRGPLFSENDSDDDFIPLAPAEDRESLISSDDDEPLVPRSPTPPPGSPVQEIEAKSPPTLDEPILSIPHSPTFPACEEQEHCSSQHSEYAFTPSSTQTPLHHIEARPSHVLEYAAVTPLQQSAMPQHSVVQNQPNWDFQSQVTFTLFSFEISIIGFYFSCFVAHTSQVRHHVLVTCTSFRAIPLSFTQTSTF